MSSWTNRSYLAGRYAIKSSRIFTFFISSIWNVKQQWFYRHLSLCTFCTFSLSLPLPLLKADASQAVIHKACGGTWLRPSSPACVSLPEAENSLGNVWAQTQKEVNWGVGGVEIKRGSFLGKGELSLGLPFWRIICSVTCVFWPRHLPWIVRQSFSNWAVSLFAGLNYKIHTS